MHALIKPGISVLLLIGSLFTFDTLKESTEAPVKSMPVPGTKPKIQVALLLDVSNSMDGLIDQAKAQLWNMVNVMGKASCGEVNPAIEIALYEYGRPANNPRQGYVKQINTFTSDLDQVSQNLFNLTTNGGEEYCGHVIYTSLTDLNWDTAAGNYKVIFIAGNEDFLQGNVTYTRACAAAKQKGVIVNTIYCGDKMQGIREHWNLAGECGNGSYTNIDQNAEMDDIATPYDSRLFLLNEQLNHTYISYGAAGAANHSKQASVDKMNYSMNKSVAAERVAVKSKKQLYNNASWDLVDAYAADSTVIAKVDLKTLPDSLQKETRQAILQKVKAKSRERSVIQKEIAAVNNKRQAFIAQVKAGKAGNNQTLETEIEKIIKQQAKRFNMVIE